MRQHAIYAYAWDLAETGIKAAADEFRALGLDTVTMAGSYHAGKFLRPHGRGKVFFPDDGTVYFRPDPTLYGDIKPLPNRPLAGRDVLAELFEDGSMSVNAWLVLMHNTPLGVANPDSVVRNAFGDPYIYSLCPSAPKARDYAKALVRDVTVNYPVKGVALESPGFAPYAHGYHHEFALVPSNAWLDGMLGLCFCDHCAERAGRRGFDAAELRADVARGIETYLDGDFDIPADMAHAFWMADVAADGPLRRYIDIRADTVTTLLSEIRDAARADAEIAVIPSVSRPTAGAWYEGTDLSALSRDGAIIEACFYEPSAARVQADLFDIRRRIGSGAPLRGILRPSHPDLSAKAEFFAAVRTLAQEGLDGIAFYNWGHLKRANLAWIGEALEQAS